MTGGSPETVPVLIVGAGGAGLTASMLLAAQGVEHLLVSARPGTSDLPKAHVLNQRAMEVLDDVGVAEAIAQRSTPAEQRPRHSAPASSAPTRTTGADWPSSTAGAPAVRTRAGAPRAPGGSSTSRRSASSR
jgi:2-polyprenyl-6-methoxyphenol hydroxylase-like FAD-dependent oxidoreductase